MMDLEKRENIKDFKATFITEGELDKALPVVPNSGGRLSLDGYVTANGDECLAAFIVMNGGADVADVDDLVTLMMEELKENGQAVPVVTTADVNYWIRTHRLLLEQVEANLGDLA